VLRGVAAAAGLAAATPLSTDIPKRGRPVSSPTEAKTKAKLR
jgi:hypothetical protein